MLVSLWNTQKTCFPYAYQSGTLGKFMRASRGSSQFSHLCRQTLNYRRGTTIQKLMPVSTNIHSVVPFLHTCKCAHMFTDKHIHTSLLYKNILLTNSLRVSHLCLITKWELTLFTKWTFAAPVACHTRCGACVHMYAIPLHSLPESTVVWNKPWHCLYLYASLCPFCLSVSGWESLHYLQNPGRLGSWFDDIWSSLI